LRLRRPEIGSPENLGALVITRKSCFAVVSLVRYQNPPHNPGMTSTMWIALILKPLVFGLVVVAILVPARKFVERHMPDGKVKRLLLRRVQ
jgi:hypothetical protein